MKLSSQEEYGLRCLLQLAKRAPGASATIAEIAQAEGLTVHHIAKLMRLLRRGGFVMSVRGQAGGYRLARPAENILLADVFSSLGGRIFDPSFCSRHAGVDHLCHHTSDCSIRSLLNTLQKVIDGVLSRLSLQDLLKSEVQLKTFMAEDPRSLHLLAETRS